MADNYTQFSVVLPVPTEAQLKRALEYYDLYQEKMDKAEEEGDAYTDIAVNFSVDDDGECWVNSTNYENVEGAIQFIQGYLKHLEYDQSFGVYMGWAGTCSKLRVNEFSGGGVVITSDKIVATNSYDCVEKAKDAGVEIFN